MNKTILSETLAARVTAEPRSNPLLWRVLVVAVFSFVVLLGWFSFRMAATRIYHADECKEISGSYMLASGGPKTGAEPVTLFQLALSRFVQGMHRSEDLMSTGRVMMIIVFWLNWMLLALATGRKLLSPGWIAAVLGVATLAPLWDFGFEIRPDNLSLSGLLLAWAVIRFQQLTPSVYLFLGALLAALEFVTAKAIVFTLPLSIVLLLFPPPSAKSVSHAKGAAMFIGGVLVSVVLGRLIFGLAGVGDAYVRTFSLSISGHEIASVIPITRMFAQAPLLMSVVLAGVIALAMEIRRNGKRALSWEGNLPEGVLFLLAVAVLAMAPALHALGVLCVTCFGFIFAFRHGSVVLRQVAGQRALFPIFGCVAVFGHFVPFAWATTHYAQLKNMHQEALMRQAESLTAPGKDFVYDGVGMVPPREWRRGSIVADPPAVVIANYVSDAQLTQADQTFIRSNYVSLEDDFRVLGRTLPNGGGDFEILHGGRYRISTLQGSDLDGTYPEGLKGLFAPEDPGNVDGTIDGRPITMKPMELAVGKHHIETASDCSPVVVWVGPTRDRIHRLGQADHRDLFLNW